MTLEKIIDAVKYSSGALVMLGIMGASFYGIAHTTYQIYTKKVVDKIIKNYEEQKKATKDF